MSRYLQCDIDDLIIFEGDNSINIPLSTKEKRTLGEDTLSEDVINTIKMHEEFESKYQIKDIYEFLLYLPLIDEMTLKNVVLRCDGNLKHQRDYVKSQLSYLHKEIPDSLAKRYADFYRDNVLRFKGPPNKLEHRGYCSIKDYLSCSQIKRDTCLRYNEGHCSKPYYEVLLSYSTNNNLDKGGSNVKKAKE